MSLAEMNLLKSGHSIRDDLLASFVVFLVALPLSLGLALVAGYPFETAAAVGRSVAPSAAYWLGCSLAVRFRSAAPQMARR